MKQEKEFLKLRDICDNIVDSEHKTAPTQEIGIPYIRTPDISNGRLNLESAKKVSEAVYKEWTERLEPQPGDLILTREAPVGEIGIIPDGEKVCLGQRTVLIRPDKAKIESKYLLYLFQTKFLKDLLYERSDGSIVNHLNMKEIRELPLPKIPTLDIQRVMSNILYTFDMKKEYLHNSNIILKKIIQSIFKSWFVDFDEQTEFEDSELGPIPKGWKVGKIESFCDTFGGGTPSTTNLEFWNGEINWAIPSDLTKSSNLFIDKTERKITKKGLDNCASQLHPKNSILMTSRATIGFFAINDVPIATNQGFIIIHPNQVNTLYYLLNNFQSRINEFIDKANGTTFLEISRGEFRKMDILIPTEDILGRFHNVVEPLYFQINSNEKEIKILTIARNSLLPKLMSGEIKV